MSLIDLNALFSDETLQYRFPMDIGPGDEVTVRFRTRKDGADSVVLLGRAVRQRMEKAYTKGGFDFYETKLTAGGERFRYVFQIEKDGEQVYYDRLGINTHYTFRMEHMFEIVPGFMTPDWAKGAVIYQIFVDRFYNGDPSNDVLDNEYSYINRPVERVTDWNAPVETEDVHRFYGGDLPGVLEKLDYLKKLGVEALYFNPIFVSPSNHKYDCQDYDHIDPHLTGFVKDEGACLPEGWRDNSKAERYICRTTDPENLEYSDKWFADCVQEVHNRGMELILCWCVNHGGSVHRWRNHDGG